MFKKKTSSILRLYLTFDTFLSKIKIKCAVDGVPAKTHARIFFSGSVCHKELLQSSPVRPVPSVSGWRAVPGPSAFRRF